MPIRASHGVGCRLVVALAPLFALAACEDSSAGSEPSPVGLYSLLFIQGEDLPALQSQSAQLKVELVAGSLNVRQNGTCEQGFEFLHTYADSMSTDEDSYDCSWARTGNTVVVEREDGYRATAQIMGTRLDMVGQDNLSFTYQR